MKENPSVLELFLYSLPDGAGFPGMRFDRAEYLGVPTKIASGHVRHLLPVPWPWGDWGRLVLFPHSSPASARIPAALNCSYSDMENPVTSTCPPLSCARRLAPPPGLGEAKF
jgi:hypothetical protein